MYSISPPLKFSLHKFSEVTKPRISHKTKKSQYSSDQLEFYLEARNHDSDLFYGPNDRVYDMIMTTESWPYNTYISTFRSWQSESAITLKHMKIGLPKDSSFPPEKNKIK